jgi:hypothetical protein
MWHPFKKVTLEAVIKNTSEVTSSPVEINIPEEVETAQLRSLKARTEISMIYERMAEGALAKLKGTTHAANY